MACDLYRTGKIVGTKLEIRCKNCRRVLYTLRDPATLIAICDKPQGPGVGEILKGWFSWVVRPNERCHCDSLSKTLDRNGPNWCERRQDWVLDRMHENAKELGVLFARPLVRAFVAAAISKSRRLTAALNKMEQPTKT